MQQYDWLASAGGVDEPELDAGKFRVRAGLRVNRMAFHDCCVPQCPAALTHPRRLNYHLRKAAQQAQSVRCDEQRRLIAETNRRFAAWFFRENDHPPEDYRQAEERKHRYLTRRDLIQSLT